MLVSLATDPELAKYTLFKVPGARLAILLARAAAAGWVKL